MSIQCCVCKKVHEKGEWHHASPAKNSKVSHTYCPECLREVMTHVPKSTAAVVPQPQLAVT